MRHRHRHGPRTRLATAVLALALSTPLAALLPLVPAAADGTASTSSGSQQPGPGAGTAAPAAALRGFYDQEAAWGDCDDGSTGFECATLTVPLDYTQPGGQTITLALKKLPASDGQADGSLFLNPGGPGGSGVDLVAGAEQFLTPQTLATYDVIGFDPRGVGGSTPVACWSEEDIAAYIDSLRAQGADGYDAETLLKAVEHPDAPGSWQPEGSPQEALAATDYVSQGRASAAACEKYSQVPELLDHMDATEVAQDMDVMREVVGDSRLNYLGVSYGTYLGAVYAERFPDKVGRVVLDSAMDPSISRTQIHTDNIAHYEESLHAYVDSCLAGEACPLSGTRTEALAQLDTFLASLDSDPLPVDGKGTTYDRTTMMSTLRFLVTRQSGYLPYLTDGLTQAITERNATTLDRNFRIVARQSLIEQGASEQTEQQLPTAEQVAHLWNQQATFNAVHCTDYPDTGDQAAWDSQAARIREANPFFYTYMEGKAYTDAFCHGWGHSTGAREPAPVRAPGSSPILVVGIHKDSQTPYHWAVTLADQLEEGHLLSVNEAAHGSVLVSTCARTAVGSFLTSGSLPQEGTVCQGDPVPVDSQQSQ